MRSVFKAWPSRLLAAMATLALVAAYAIGAYAHASGHHHPPGPHPAAVHGHVGTAQAASKTEHADQAGHHHATAPLSDHCRHGQAGGGADDNEGTGPAFDCCDTICQGGQAVVAAAAPVPPSPFYLPAIEPTAAFDGAKPGGPDRPPKAFRSA